MATNDTLPTALRDEIVALLAPLVDAARQPVGVQLLMQSMGRTDAVGGRADLRREIERLAGLVQEIADLQPEVLDSWSGVARLLALADDLFRSARGVEHLVQDPTLADQACDLGRDLIEQLLAMHLRARHPTLFRAACLLTLVRPAEIASAQPMVADGAKVVRLPWCGDRLQLERVDALLKRPLPTLSEHYFPNHLDTAADAHESARRLFPLLRLLAHTLGLKCFEDRVVVGPPSAPPPAELNESDHFGDDEHDAGALAVEFPQAESMDLTPYLESVEPRFVVVLPGQVSDGVAAPARFAVAARVTSARHPGAARGLIVELLGQLAFTETRDSWRLTLESEGSVPGFVFGPDGAVLAPDALAGATASAKLRIEREAAAGAPAFVFGASTGTRLEIGALQLGADLRATGSAAAVVLAADAHSGALVIAPGDGDGFLSSILPGDGLQAKFDLGLEWSNERGLTFRGAGGLDATLPIGLSIGGVTLSTIHLGLHASDAGLLAEVSANVAASIGPVQAVLDRVGIAAAVTFPDDGGNLGVVDLDVGFKPPSGLGLAIDAAVVVGGGFLRFDPEKGEYSGVMQLEVAEKIAIKAIGLLMTKMPGGAKGYSLMVIITAEDFAPIQLGYGFVLTGIGGLLAINRTFDEDALRAGLKNHTLDSVMFPQDPIRNAPQILSNLNRVFPPANGHHLFGPMAQISWGTPALITADLGVVLEFGARLRLLILAQVVAVLPKRENDLVRLQMDAIGVIDFDQGSAALDATLYDSRLLKKFVLTGDMAMRMNWEGAPNFALAIGGLHPAFNPPANFPKLGRIAINLSSGDNPRIRCEAYFALTANTVQFGARAELYAAAAGFSIHGGIGFDVLIQLDPFQFLAEFYAQLQLKRGSSNLFKVKVQGALAGPRPLHVKAKATFEILWWDVTIRVDKTLVGGEKPPLPEPIDVLPRLKEALANPGNWVAELPNGQRPMVSLREKPGAATEVLLHPLGTLTVKQSVVPLDIDISRFGQTAPVGARRFTISSVSLGEKSQTLEPVKEFFAPAQFFEMSDDEKLSRPSFEPMAAGISLGSEEFALTSDGNDWLEVEAIKFETIIMNKEKNETRRSDPEHLYQLRAELFGKQARFGAAGASALRRSGKAKYRSLVGKHRMAKEGWSVVSTDNLTVESLPGIEADKPASYSQTAQALHLLKLQNPAKAATLKIMRLSEVS